MSQLSKLLIALCGALAVIVAGSAILLSAEPENAEGSSSSAVVSSAPSVSKASSVSSISSVSSAASAQFDTPPAVAVASEAASSSAPAVSSTAAVTSAPAPVADGVCSIASQEVGPGETLLFTIETAAGDASDAKIDNDFGFNARFTPIGDGRFVGFLPVSYFTQPGSYRVTVRSQVLAAPQVFAITVVNKQFDLQRLTVDEGVANDTIFNDDATVEYRQKIWPMKEKYDDARYFDGPFIRPAEGGITTQFGMMRTVNGKPNPRHDGYDISAGTGTPVQAAQNGRVLFADFVKLTGNTVILEHGCGLKTWYMHMDSLDVAADDMVKTGDILGKVGATGFVTGPHLHYSASINGVYIDPFILSDTDLLEFAVGGATQP